MGVPEVADQAVQGFDPALDDLGAYLPEDVLDEDVDVDGIGARAGEPFNINYPKQLSYILFEKLNLPTGKKTKTGYSTDAEVLEKLTGKFEIAKRLLDYRQLTKLLTTYVDVLPQLVDPFTKRLHTSWSQVFTATGRLSSSEPNLQNILVRTEVGAKIRQAFVPEGEEYLILDEARTSGFVATL